MSSSPFHFNEYAPALIPRDSSRVRTRRPPRSKMSTATRRLRPTRTTVNRKSAESLTPSPFGLKAGGTSKPANSSLSLCMPTTTRVLASIPAAASPSSTCCQTTSPPFSASRANACTVPPTENSSPEKSSRSSSAPSPGPMGGKVTSRLSSPVGGRAWPVRRARRDRLRRAGQSRRRRTGWRNRGACLPGRSAGCRRNRDFPS